METQLHKVIGRRPLVPVVHCGAVTEALLQAILYGLEEEGIPSICAPIQTRDLKTTVKETAQLSRLNLAIGLSTEENLVLLHHRDLATEAPLFQEPLIPANLQACRRLGANAARMVKGNPLLFANEEQEPASTPSPQIPVTEPRNPLTLLSQEELITRIVEEIVKQMQQQRGDAWQASE